MATFKEIYGTNVEALASDPANPIEGQIWYNTTSQTLKGYALVAGSWATAAPLNTARTELGSSRNSNSSFSIWRINNSPAEQEITESYNGTAWTELNDLNTARRFTGANGLLQQL
jgi:hypothetical protein